MRMLHLDPDEFLIDSFRLGRLVYASGFRPKHLVSIWRGGTPVGLGVDAFYRSRGVTVNHTTIATGSYKGIGQPGEVAVRNLEHIVRMVCPEDGVLIIDDVFESGNTIKRVVELLRAQARANTPNDIRVAALHRKPALAKYHELPLYTLQDIDEDIWIDYPHELADLAGDDDPEDRRIREKDEGIWRILHEDSPPVTELDDTDRAYHYLSARDLLLDSVRLGVKVARDASWHPHFLIALWPGGVLAGLPVHEVYKYTLRKAGGNFRAPDHISINATGTAVSYRSNVVGLQYLSDTVNRDDNVLIIDTTFRAGRLVNDVVTKLKEVLRRNLSHKRIRVASVYYNPADTSTWTATPDIPQPHYYLRTTTKEIIYPASVHKLPDPRKVLRRVNPELWKVLYTDD